MKKKLIISLFLFFLTGCWNYQELNDCAIVTGMAIDFNAGKYEVSLLISNGSKKDEEGSSAQIAVSSAEGISVYEAIKNISLSSPKELYISHLSVIVISEEVAKEGMNPILDFLLRDPQSHQNFYLVLAKNTKAKDCLSVLAPLSDYPSQNITANIKITEKLQGRITNAGFNNFVSKIMQKGNNPVANSLVLVGNAKDGVSEEEQEKSISSAYTKLDTLGLFKNDKLIAWATIDESIGINMLLNDVEMLYFTIPCENSNMVITTNKYDLKNKVSKEKIDVSIEAEGMINEVGCTINLEDPKTISEYEKKAQEQMLDYTYKALDKAKRLGVDVLGYGNMIYRKYPKYFNSISNWDNSFKNLEVNVKIKFNLQNKGALEQTIGELMK